jgi:ribonuclease VapC
MLIDASALVAILTRETDADALADTIARAAQCLTTPLALYEATLTVMRTKKMPMHAAQSAVLGFVSLNLVRIVPIDAAIGDTALAAFERFGKGRHRAGLNMGDCFAYASARAHGVPLLCKGDDFAHTDIDLAL